MVMMGTFIGYLMGTMKSELKDFLFDEVLSYFRERLDALNKGLKKHIEAGDVIAEDEARAKIIIEAVAVVLARRIERKTTKASSTKVEPGKTIQPRFRGVLTQTAYYCIQKLDGEFTAKELTEQMRSAGYQFGGHPDVSTNEVLQKCLKDGWVEVTEQGAGRRPTYYRRARPVEDGE